MPSFSKITLLYLPLLLLAFSSHAANNTASSLAPAELISQVNQQQLWTKTIWLNLLHYKGQPGKNQAGDYLSQVDDPVFFNAENGNTNPKAELIATLNALYNANFSLGNAHAQCRFMARLNWLRQTLADEMINLPAIKCAEYNEWRKQVPAHKVSLIFPAYHLNSPSSMFGHTLLRLDSKDETGDATWLSMAVNFGANIQNSDNSISFAFKGLAGGYSGNFIVNPYYTKIKEYNRQENRDIWEYPLNLSPDETERMVRHLWELKGINFDYYFFDENCSYRLLELLEVARPSLKLTDQFGLTAIPIDTVRSIDQADLITDIHYRPSQATRIRFLLKRLSLSEQNLVLQLSQNAELIKSADFKQLSPNTKNIVLDAAYRYLRFQQNDHGRTEDNAKNSFLILQAVNAIDDFESVEVSFTEQQKPEKGHLSKRIRIAAGSDNIKGSDNLAYTELQFRMSFHSLEDNLNGFLEGAQINIVSFALRANKEDVQLQQLDLIDIFSLSPRNQFFQPLSWRVYTGLEQQWINGADHLTAHVTAGAGATYEPWSRGYFYAMATTRLESNSQFSKTIEPALGYSSGLLQHFSSGTSHLEFSGEYFLNDEYRQRIKFTHNIQLARNHALLLRVTRQRQRNTEFTDAQLSYQYFFH